MLAVLVDVVVETVSARRVCGDDEIRVERTAVGEDHGGLVVLRNKSSTSAESAPSKSARQIVRWLAGSLMMAPELQTSGASSSSCWQSARRGDNGGPYRAPAGSPPGLPA